MQKEIKELILKEKSILSLQKAAKSTLEAMDRCTNPLKPESRDFDCYIRAQICLLISQSQEIKKTLKVVIPLVQEYSYLKRSDETTGSKTNEFNAILQYGLENVKKYVARLNVTKEILNEALKKKGVDDSLFSDLIRELMDQQNSINSQIAFYRSVNIITDIDDIFSEPISNLQYETNKTAGNSLPPIERGRESLKRINIDEIAKKVSSKAEIKKLNLNGVFPHILPLKSGIEPLKTESNKAYLRDSSKKVTLSKLVDIEEMVKNFIPIRRLNLSKKGSTFRKSHICRTELST